MFTRFIEKLVWPPQSDVSHANHDVALQFIVHMFCVRIVNFEYDAQLFRSSMHGSSKVSILFCMLILFITGMRFFSE